MSCCLPSQITKSLKRLYFDASRTGDLQSCLSPEIQVLVACARTSPIPWKIQQLLTVDLDWQRILDLAIDYELAPLLYFNLRKLGPSRLIPSEIVERLKSLYKQDWLAAMNAFARVEEILLTFSRQETQVIVLKGAALASLIYPSVALRPMVDLDLLVRPTDLDRADDNLRQLGYVVDESYQSQEWYKERHHHLAPYMAPDRFLTVELHHHVVSPLRAVKIPIDEFWRRAQPAQIASASALVLAPEDLLLSTCVHLSLGKCFAGVLRDLCDIAETLALYRGVMNWDHLVRRARAYQAEKCLYYSLWLAQSLTQVRLPTHLLENLEPEMDNAAIEDICLKFLIPRAVFFDSSSIPSWAITESIAELLRPREVRSASEMVSKWLRQHFARFATQRTAKRK